MDLGLRKRNLGAEMLKPGYMDKPDEEHVLDLLALCGLNTGAQDQDVIRGITINHILLLKTIKELNRKNTILMWIAITVSAFSIIFGALALVMQ